MRRCARLSTKRLSKSPKVARQWRQPSFVGSSSNAHADAVSTPTTTPSTDCSSVSEQRAPGQRGEAHAVEGWVLTQSPIRDPRNVARPGGFLGGHSVCVHAWPQETDQRECPLGSVEVGSRQQVQTSPLSRPLPLTASAWILMTQSEFRIVPVSSFRSHRQKRRAHSTHATRCVG
jgi:hypothetical protein